MATIIGCGAWGTTLAKILAENGHSTTIWCHDQNISDNINGQQENNFLLPGIKLPKNIKATISLDDLSQEKELIVIVTASKFFQQTIKNIKEYLSPKTMILSATKGLDEKTDQRMSEILSSELPEYAKNIAVLSGPNIALEIAEQKPCTAVIASNEKATAEKIQKIFNNNYFRVYTNNDVIGTEFGGTLKNVIAIAAGIIDGQNLGSNSKAALMVRGITEMSRLAVKLGAKPETLFGLTGMGDLITTCSSELSRNHSVGAELAKGRKITDILQGMRAVAEGVATTKVAHNLAKKTRVSMPITEQMYQVLYENKPIHNAIKDLMTRETKPE